MPEIYPNRKEYSLLAKKYNKIPVYIELPGDLYTPISLFLKIRKGPYQFLLESAVSGKYLGRYSFMGTSDQAISCKDYKIFFRKKDKIIEEITKEQPLNYLRDYFKKIRAYHHKDLPPFVNGMVGYFGYDSIQYFEKINLASDDELQLKDFELIIADNLIVYDNLTNKLFLIYSPLIASPGEVITIYEKAEIVLKKMADQIKSALPQELSLKIEKNKDRIIYRSNFSKEKFRQEVERAKKYIYEGDIFQVVLSQRLKVGLEGDSFSLYRSLRAINPSPYMFYLKCDQAEIIGSSPEIQVQLTDNQVTVRPIAGTRPRGASPKEDKLNEKSLLADQKELAEHLMLVDLGRNDVGRVCQGGSVKLDTFQAIEYYSHVMHIVSNVVGQLDTSYDMFDLIKATFPAGTVSGAPKIRAMEIISQLEPARRGIYSGLVGYLTFDNHLDSCIAIRTFVIKNKTVYLQAGAGIVADSIPENEYYETLHKLKVLTRALERSGEQL